MIKKIQADTGAKVQFINLNEDTPDDRRCLITGNPDQVAEAKQRIEALVDSALVSCLVCYLDVDMSLLGSS